MKDPAVLFYTEAFLTGCATLTMEERGQYITMLSLQHQLGHLSEKTIRLSVGLVSVDVMNKFIKDENGNFYNERMDLEIDKRQTFVDSRRENGRLGGRPKEENNKPLGKPIGYPLGKPTNNLRINRNKDTNKDKIIDINIVDIIDYLNEKNNSNYRKDNAKTISLLNKILKDYTLEDVKKVIDIKVKEWKGTDMEKFIRPETLFGNKFESYFNQKPKTTTRDVMRKLLQEELECKEKIL